MQAGQKEVRSRKADVVVPRILDAAQVEFMASGFERANIDRMLKDFGGSKATVFRHFPSKRELFAAVIERIARRWEQTVDFEHIVVTTPREWLAEYCARVLGWLLSDEPMFIGRTAIAEGGSFPDLRHIFPSLAMTPIQEVIARNVERWSHSGLIAASAPELVSTMVMDEIIISAVARKLFGIAGLSSDSEIREHVLDRVDLLFEGLSPRG